MPKHFWKVIDKGKDYNCNYMKKIPVLSIIFILLISFLNVFPAYPSDENIYDKVTDLSDRKYEQVLIDLLDNAKESIVVSMYGISPGAGEKLKRLEDVLKFVKSNTQISGIPDYLEDLPEGISICEELSAW